MTSNEIKRIKRTSWNYEEEKILIENYEKVGATECSKLLDRTTRACFDMAKKLGLRYNKSSNYNNKEKLQKIVSESNTYVEVLAKLNLKKGCGNSNTLKKYIKQYNINTEHFFTKEQRAEHLKHNNTKLELDDMLILNSTSSRNSLKKRLYDEGIKERKCELCGQDENWNGKKMSLILDHINGINDDNRLENLRIVCPNCNATLDTHCGKNNKKNDLSFCECGDKKSKRAKQCSKCFGISNRKIEWPDYENLIKDINELGYSGTGKKYNVSYNAIKEWVLKLEK